MQQGNMTRWASYKSLNGEAVGGIANSRDIHKDLRALLVLSFGKQVEISQNRHILHIHKRPLTIKQLFL